VDVLFIVEFSDFGFRIKLNKFIIVPLLAKYLFEELVFVLSLLRLGILLSLIHVEGK